MQSLQRSLNPATRRAARGRRAHLPLLALLLALVVSISSCGDDDGSDSASSGSGNSASGGEASLPSSPVVDRVVDAGRIKVGMATTMPWLGQDPNTQEYFGPSRTLADLVAKELGVEVEYIPVNWDTFVAALQSGQVDLVGAPLWMTPERQEVVSMVEWSTSGTCYLTKEESDLSTLEDLKQPGVKFGASAGSGGAELVKTAYPDGELVVRQAAPGETFLYPELRSGAVDVTPVDNVLVPLLLSQHEELKAIPEDCPDTSDAPTPIGVAFQKGDAGLEQVISKVAKENQDVLAADVKKYSAPSYMKKYSGS